MSSLFTKKLDKLKLNNMISKILSRIKKWYYTKNININNYSYLDKVLNNKKYKYFVIKGKGDFYDPHLTDISNIKIKNKGDIELPFVYEIPDDYIFYNTGDIFLSGIKPDEIDAGECKRSLRVINQNGILKIRLGCFYGTKEEAITAITYKYYNNPDIIHLIDPYLDKVNLSFEKQILRQTKIS